MPYHTLAQPAKALLQRASQWLGTANPVREVGDILDQSLSFPAGEEDTPGKAMEPIFSETAANNLSFVMAPGGPRAGAGERIDTSTRAMRHMASHFGRDAVRWFDGRAEAAIGPGAGRSVTWGASFGTAFDADGMAESLAAYEWGPHLMDALPAPLFQIARVALETMPGLRPAFTTIRCGRTSGSQQITFESDYALKLGALKPLMDALGLGHQHGAMVSATAFVLGARFTLPPGTAGLTFRPTRAGVEMRLDVNLDALPDPPPQLVPLLQLQLTERPRSLRALSRWIAAMTPDGFAGPGSLSVLSVSVRADMPPRVALYLRPAALGAAAAPGASDSTRRPSAPRGAAALPRGNGSAGAGGGEVVAAGAESLWVPYQR